MYPRALPCGDSALTIEFGETVDANYNDMVTALDLKLSTSGLPVLECVPTYRSLLIEYDGAKIDYQTIADQVIGLCAGLSAPKFPKRHWRVPVVYGGTFGIDLEDLAQHHSMTSEQIVARHASTTYRVYTVGFMPGFTYLGGLDPVLTTPRRATPRLSVPEGSITIGGAQTAITSIEAPCGWHVIGRSPVRAFKAERNPPCLFQVGDLVSFQPIPSDSWHELALAAYRGQVVASII